MPPEQYAPSVFPPPRAVAEALRYIRELTGIPCIWKTVTCWQQGDPAFSEDLFHHCNPFCVAVKEDAGCLEKCKFEELEVLFSTIERERKPYFRRCHAGVIELIVPVIYLGQVEGCLLLGPFRSPKAEPGIPNKASRLLRHLPKHEQERMTGMQALLQTVASGLAGLSSISAFKQPTDTRITKAIAYIRGHLEVPLSANEVARHCGMSVSRFTHLFTQLTGLSFSRYVIELRIEQAKRLLIDPNNNKAEIALGLGFSDQSHFSNTFKRITGRTPGAFQTWVKQHSESHGDQSAPTVA